MISANELQLLTNSRIRFNNPEIPEGIRILSKVKYFDERGSFQEDLNISDLRMFDFGNFFQKNISVSRAGVIRGMHWQNGDYAQAKVLSCIQGSVIDVVIDLRRTSSTYLSINSFKLDASEPKYIGIPKGFAHGFQALEDNTIFSYYVDAPYAPKNEMCINPLSQELDCYWESIPKIINEKDQSAIMLRDYVKKVFEDSEL